MLKKRKHKNGMSWRGKVQNHKISEYEVSK